MATKKRSSKKAKPVVQVHLDGDYLAYSAGFAAQHTFRVLTGEDHEGILGPFTSAEEVKACLALPGNVDKKFLQYERIEVEPVENALHTVKLQINDLLEQVSRKFPSHVPELGVYLTGTGNFREKIATIKPYKGNRPPWHRPRLYREIRGYLQHVWNAQVVHDQEADDEVCIRQTAAEEAGIQSVIVGIDKDLWQCPGWHYSTSKRGFARIGPAMGLRLFYRQLLSGDATDNIGGVYKVGAKKAKDAIQPGMSEKEMFQVCLDAYRASVEKYGPEKCGYAVAEDALEENATLLWLRRRRGETYQDALAQRKEKWA